ncbi:MAG: hypothetical protein AAF403_06835, partial [Pseudomonadota bacterium]
MILLATRKRPQQLKSFIDDAVKAQTSHTILVGIDADDDSYDQIEMPPFMVRLKTPANLGGVARIYQYMYHLFPNEPWYGMMCDDIRIHTPFWDRMLAQGALDYHVITAKNSDNDLYRSDADHAFISGRYLASIGGTNYLNFRHFFGDIYVRSIALNIGMEVYYTDDVF